MISASQSVFRWTCLPLLLVMLAGCEARPSAPALQDGPVCRDPREGFRFFVPEEWKQRARGTVPRGKIDGERMLAEYRSPTSHGTFMVTVADVPASEPLGEYITKTTLTGEKWEPKEPAEDFTINDVPAARITFVMHQENGEMIREVIAFRRGERVYFFKGFYADKDTSARKAIAKAVDTIVW